MQIHEVVAHDRTATGHTHSNRNLPQGPLRLPIDRILHRLHNRPLRALIQPIQLPHLLRAQLEIVHIRVLLDPAGRVALRQGDPILLQTVPNQHLRRRLAMRLRNRIQRRVRSLLIAHKGGIGLDHDAVLVAVLDNLALLAPGVQLDLIRARRPGGGIILQLLDVPDAEIAHSDGSRLPFFVQLLQGQPHLLALRRAAVRRVDQEQIDVAVRARVDGRYAVEEGVVCSFYGPETRHDFRGDEDLVSREAGLGECFAYFALVAVELGRVDVPGLVLIRGLLYDDGAWEWQLRTCSQP
jgi:hypothetical protein